MKKPINDLSASWQNTVWLHDRANSCVTYKPMANSKPEVLLFATLFLEYIMLYLFHPLAFFSAGEMSSALLCNPDIWRSYTLSFFGRPANWEHALGDFWDFAVRNPCSALNWLCQVL